MDSEPFYGLRNSRSWCAWLFIFFVDITKITPSVVTFVLLLKNFYYFCGLSVNKVRILRGVPWISKKWPNLHNYRFLRKFCVNWSFFSIVWKVHYWGGCIVTKSGYFEGIPWPSKKYPNLYNIIDFSVNFAGFGIFSFCVKGSIIVKISSSRTQDMMRASCGYLGITKISMVYFYWFTGFLVNSRAFSKFVLFELIHYCCVRLSPN